MRNNFFGDDFGAYILRCNDLGATSHCEIYDNVWDNAYKTNNLNFYQGRVSGVISCQRYEDGTFIDETRVFGPVHNTSACPDPGTQRGEPPNTAPVANAGPDQTVTDADGNGTEAVTLDGTGSFDPDGTIASYDWSEGGDQPPTRAVIFGPPDITFPIGSAVSGPQTFSQTLAVDATGFENLTLSFTIAGIDDIEPNCGSGGSSDCFEVFEGAVSIVDEPHPVHPRGERSISRHDKDQQQSHGRA